MKVLFIKLRGGCMRPLFRSGQVCIIYPSDKIRIGDLVVYKYAGKMFLHRVIKVLPNSLTVNDDCGICERMEVPYTNVLGKTKNLLSGPLGYIYHLIVRPIFILGRSLKPIVTAVKAGK